MMKLPGATNLAVAGVQPVTNLRHQWVALAMHLPAGGNAGALCQVFGGEDGLLAACGNLPLLVPGTDPFAFTSADLEQMGNAKLILALSAARCNHPEMEAHLRSLYAAGARFVLDVGPSAAMPPLPPALQSLFCAVLLHCSEQVPKGAETLLKTGGLHIAAGVGHPERWTQCKQSGFSWFLGNFALQPGVVRSEGTSRARLLKMLNLIARDADARELEILLKQDLPLSFHLLKLVNSAAFAPARKITNFTQAINVLGRRQLQRWLQLLLYARSNEENQHNPLLPLAALRANLMEGLCRAQGGSAEECEQAFMAGMFSLLGAILSSALDEVITALKLEPALCAALLHREGELGQLLMLVEQATGAHTGDGLRESKIAPEVYWQAMHQALHWATVVVADS